MKRVGFRQPRDGVVLLCGTTGKECDECARCEQCEDSAVSHVEFLLLWKRVRRRERRRSTFTSLVLVITSFALPVRRQRLLIVETGGTVSEVHAATYIVLADLK